MSTQIELLKKYGLAVRGFSGQHLLIDPNIQRKIVDALAAGPKDRILEIGPGLGALTWLILERGCRCLWAVEKDKRFVEVLEGEYGAEYKDRLKIIHQDILEFNFKKLAAGRSKTQWKVISNLPYYITAPILFSVFEYRKIFSKAVLMMQKEVARRLVAVPGSKDYGRLSLATRYCADAKILFHVSKSCFSPKPEVDSTVVELEFHVASKVLPEEQEKLLFNLIQAAFGQRRKTLLHALSHAPQLGLSRDLLRDLFKKLGFSEKVRGEELLLKDYWALTETLAQSQTTPDAIR